MWWLPSRSITMTCRVCLFNSAVLIDREGNVAGVYDKQHLWALERLISGAATALRVPNRLRNHRHHDLL